MLDANVLISAFLYGGRLSVIADLIERGVVTPCFTTATFQEVERVLRYSKFAELLAERSLTADAVANAITHQSVIVPDPPVIPSVIRDIPDNFLLACATATAAEAVVSGDKQVLALGICEGIPILTPAKFLSWTQRR